MDTLFAPRRILRCVFVPLLALACSSASLATTWSVGQFVTYQQAQWGDNSSAAYALLAANFGHVYSSDGGAVLVGDPAGFAMVFDSAPAIDAYLPTAGAPGALDQNLADPTDTSSGVFGGDVLALQLDVDFSNVGLLPSSGVKFGDLQLVNLASFGLNCVSDGTTVGELLAVANTELGGGSGPCSFTDLDLLVELLDFSFDGNPTAFAQDSLVAPNGGNGGGGTGVPEPGTLALFGLGLAGLGLLRRKLAR